MRKVILVNFFVNEILICYLRTQIFELCYISEGLIGYVYIVSSVLATRNEQGNIANRVEICNPVEYRRVLCYGKEHRLRVFQN
jgi:hypothetical protein